jgi:hypothetical protein
MRRQEWFQVGIVDQAQGGLEVRERVHVVQPLGIEVLVVRAVAMLGRGRQGRVQGEAQRQVRPQIGERERSERLWVLSTFLDGSLCSSCTHLDLLRRDRHSAALRASACR